MPPKNYKSLNWAVILVTLLCVLAGIGYWAFQRLHESQGALSKATVVDTLNQRFTDLGIAKTSAAESLVDKFTYAGEPKATGYPNSITRLTNKAFLIAYDEQRENPAWAAYRIPGERKYGPLPRSSRFSADTRTQARVTHDDYTNTGYDRGHMVPNLAIASRFGAKAQAETFFMSNIVPQKPALNQGPWRLLEETIAETTAPHCTEIWVIVGPIYESPGETLPSGSVIPKAFFMLIADETAQGPRLQAFIMPQTISRGADFRNYRTTVQDVQVRTGLDFFWELPDPLENRLENEQTEYWLER